MQQRTTSVLRPAALIAALLLAGFGCRPILDAHQEQQQTIDEQRQESLWNRTEPRFESAMNPDGTGKVFITFQTQQNSTVTVNLEGPGVVGAHAQTLPVDANGNVSFEWRIDRTGRYDYFGTVIFNRVVVYTFEDYGDVY
ncbi:MAG TPA: hypothetical protein VL500_05075 [Candidatus Eisenbacteria bacterium]|nr:hypothetical protein [Candidatus Eisenbacteria bacterium]